MDDITFEQCAKDEVAKIYADWVESEYRCLVMRGTCALCAYIGVTKDHPLYGKGYNDLTIDCHGGLTFAREGDGVYRPADRWWFGWDYGHYGDMSFYDLEYNEYMTGESHKWTPQEVKNEVPWVINQFEKLTRLMRSMQQ